MLSLLSTVMLACIVSCGSSLSLKAAARNDNCPPPGTEVSFDKVMNAAFIEDYVGCDVAFYLAGNQGYVLQYDTKSNATFQVVAPGGEPMPSLVRAKFGTFCGIDKSKSDIIFSLQRGDAIMMRGGPRPKHFSGNLYQSVFQADSITNL